MPFTFKSAQKAVAAFILVAILLFIAIIVLIAKGNDLLVLKREYYTFFQEGYGLTGGNTIKYKGINIGKIKSMVLTEDDRIRVTVQITKPYLKLMREDSVIKISSSLLGGASLVLVTTPNSDSPQLEPGSMMLSSDMDKGQDLILKLSETGPKKEELTDKVKDIMNMILDLKPVLNATLLNVRDMTGNLKTLTGSLKGGESTATSEKLFAILDNIRRLTGQGKLDNLIDSLDGALKNVKTLTAKDEPTMVMLREDLVELRNTLRSVQGSFLLGGTKSDSGNTIKTGGRE
jgi:phospholipid/cholesterol/gamma-HCH transport system substrate-binding protein